MSRLARIHLDPLLGEQRMNRMRQRERDFGRDRSAIRTAAHKPGIGSRAQCQSQSVQQDGLARARLAGQHAETSFELEFELLDQNDIADCELPQHARAGLSSAVRSAACAAK